MNTKKLSAILATLILFIQATTVSAALINRGGGLIYDDSLNITWLQNSNLAMSNTFNVSGINADGSMDWNTANLWIEGMNTDNGTGYLGYSGWRMPTLVDFGNDGCNYSNNATDCGFNSDTATSEMANLFYSSFGNLGFYDTSGNSNQPGWGLNNTNPLVNFQSSFYWSGLAYTPDTGRAWGFNFPTGEQGSTNIGGTHYVLAVHSGDIGAVPIPAAIWLFFSGFAGLICFSRITQKNT